MKKVIIWGHKLGTHTHSYVHFGYYRAAQFLGYETYWFDDNDDLSNFNFSDCIFITEHNVCKNMPVKNDCIYFNHNVDLPFAFTSRDTEHRLTHQNYYNFVYFADHWDPKHNIVWPDISELKKISQHHYYHQKTKTITTMWATDLLPHEIDQLEPKLFDKNNDNIYFIGSRQGNNINIFENICNRHGKHFQNYGGYSGKNNLYTGLAPDLLQNVNMVRDSYISVDIRDAPHLVQGRYYPCRLFKNISYGKWTGSNHKGIEDVFEDNFTCESNLELLYDKLVKDSRDCTYDKMKKAMMFIKDKHTYVNRINDMFSILK
jgi:hypothetical protein